MDKLFKRHLPAAAAGAVLCVASFAALAANSGFLKDYSQLQTVKDGAGAERRIWVNEKLSATRYEALMLDPVEFYPKPEPTEQVSLGALTDIRNYVEASLRTVVGATVPFAKTAGPGVILVRTAVTAASVDKGLKPYQLIPVALVATTAKRATGREKYAVELKIESEFLDSVTGEVLARGVRQAKGVEVQGDAPLTLKLAQPQIDAWAKALQAEILARAPKASAAAKQ